MERRDLERAVARARHLRGLLALPLAVVFVASGLGNLRWGPLRQNWVFVLILALAGAAWWQLTAYYNDHYGRVAAPARPTLRYTLAGAVFGAAAIGGPLLDTALDVPISMFAALFAVAALVWYAACTEVRPETAVVWSALLLVALLPVWGSLSDKTSVAWLPIAAATAISGLLDHRSLVRAFGPRHALEGARGRAGT